MPQEYLELLNQSVARLTTTFAYNLKSIDPGVIFRERMDRAAGQDRSQKRTEQRGNE